MGVWVHTLQIKSNEAEAEGYQVPGQSRLHGKKEGREGKGGGEEGGGRREAGRIREERRGGRKEIEKKCYSVFLCTTN